MSLLFLQCEAIQPRKWGKGGFKRSNHGVNQLELPAWINQIWKFRKQKRHHKSPKHHENLHPKKTLFGEKKRETELLPRLGHSNDHAKGRQSTGDNVQTPSLKQGTEQLHQPSDCPQKDWFNHKKKALLEVQKKNVVLFLFSRLRLLRAEACSRIRGRALTNDQSHFSAKTQNPKVLLVFGKFVPRQASP